jgi:molybdopterin-synthase adenylyltransferase
MKRIIEIPEDFRARLASHFFQNRLEQGAFLFADASVSETQMILTVQNIYLVPESAWDIQNEVYLEMSNDERAKVMKMARDRGSCLVDCHSHPHASDDVWFSPSDRYGINEFAQYAKWKLDNRPFAATVWGEASIDAVMWQSDFLSPMKVDEVVIGMSKIVPRQSWFRRARGFNRFSNGYEPV